MAGAPLDDVDALKAVLAEYAPRIWEGRARHPIEFDNYIDAVSDALHRYPGHEWVRKMRAVDLLDLFRPELGYTFKLAEVYFLVNCYMR